MSIRPYYHATERCSCGATIDVDAYTTDDLRESLTAWREQHRHEAVMTRLFGGSTESVGDRESESSREDEKP